MSTRLTIPHTYAFNESPALFQDASGRYHCLHWFDDGVTNMGLWHTYLDTISGGWQTGQAVILNDSKFDKQIVGVIQKESDPNAGRIIVYFGDPNGTVNIGDIYEVHTDDDGATWSSPILVMSAYKPGSVIKHIEVIKLDTGRWLFAAVYDSAGGGSPYNVYTFYSDDEGATFSLPTPHEFFLSSDAQVVLYQLRYGKVVLAMLDATGQVVRIVRSRERGATWEERVWVYSGSAADYNPSLTQTETGRVLCAFETNEDGTYDIKCVHSDDDGYNWGNKVTVYSSVASDVEPVIYRYTSLTILCAFSTNEDGNYDIKMVKSTDNGLTWGSKVTVSASGTDERDPDLILLRDGRLLCSYIDDVVGANKDIYYVTSTDGGVTWGAPVLIFQAGYGIHQPTIIELEDGTLICAFMDGLSGNADVKAVRSLDGGATWDATPTIIASALGPEQHPDLIDLGNGLVGCVYEDRIAGIYQLRMAVSSNAGVGWGQTVDVVSVPSSDTRNAAMLQLASGRFICAYDMLSGTQQIHAIHSPDGFTWEQLDTTLDNASRGLLGRQFSTGRAVLWVYDTVVGAYVQYTAYDEDALEWGGLYRAGIIEANPPPTTDLSDVIVDTDGAILFALVDDGGSASDIITYYATKPASQKLAANLKSFTGLEGPQIVLTWDRQTTTLLTGTDGVTNIGVDAYNFNSITGGFGNVALGDRLVITNTPASAVDGTYAITAIVDDNNVKVLTPFASSIGSLDFEVVRGLPDEIEIRRAEYDYPQNLNDGNFCRRDTPPVPGYDSFYGDAGELKLSGNDGVSVSPNVFNSATGGFSANVSEGDYLQIRDDVDIRNNGIYTVIEVTSDISLKVHRDLPIAGLSGLDFDLWHGPLTYRTYYYSLFMDRVASEPLFGLDRIIHKTWCFSGGIDYSSNYDTFGRDLFAMMPKVYQRRDTNKIVSQPNEVIEYGEVIFRGGNVVDAGHLERLSRLVGLLLQRGEDLIDNFPTAWTIALAPPDVLAALAENIGTEINQYIQRMPIQRWRKYLSIMPLIYQRKGTFENAVLRLARFYGYTIELDSIIPPLSRGHLDTSLVIASGNTGASSLPNIFTEAGGGFTGAVAGQWLHIQDSSTEADNGIYKIKTILSDTQMLLEYDFPTGGLSNLEWSIYTNLPFDHTTFDSYDPAWEAIMLFALYRDGVYQLWSEPDTQFIFEEIRKVTPHYLALTYNEEAPS